MSAPHPIKLVRIISEHKQPKSRGQVEAIVVLSNGELVTRHLSKESIAKLRTEGHI